MNQFPELNTQRLVLREFQSSDAQAVFGIFSQDSVTKYLDSEKMQIIDEAAKKINSRIGLFRNGMHSRGRAQ
jgi:hypothetical protein